MNNISHIVLDHYQDIKVTWHGDNVVHTNKRNLVKSVVQTILQIDY